MVAPLQSSKAVRVTLPTVNKNNNNSINNHETTIGNHNTDKGKNLAFASGKPWPREIVTLPG